MTCRSLRLATPSVWQTTGDGQTGVPGYRLPAKITVRVIDADGRPIVGDTIDFTPSDAYAAIETGAVPPDAYIAMVTGAAAGTVETVTDSTGSRFRLLRRLGGTLGTQTLSARSSIPGVPTQTFSATAQSSYMVSIDGGDAGLCGVDLSGRLGCWLPPRSYLPDLVPHVKLVNSSLHFTQVAMVGTALPWPGGIFKPATACALTDTGRLQCFTVDSMANATAPTDLSGTYPALTQLVSAGFAGTTFCGLTAAGQAWCWGSDNTFGQLGDGTTVPHTSPAAVATTASFGQIDIGGAAVCGLTAAGTVSCWGLNAGMQAGVPSTNDVISMPSLVNTPARFVSIRATYLAGTSCGFLAAGGMMCWGYLGEFGGPAAATSAVPMSINLQPAPIDLVENVNFNNFGDPQTFVLDRSLTLHTAGFRTLPGSTLPPQGLIRNVTLAHGAGFICGTAALGNATLCPSNRFVYQFVDVIPAGGFIQRPPVAGVPFP